MILIMLGVVRIGLGPPLGSNPHDSPPKLSALAVPRYKTAEPVLVTEINPLVSVKVDPAEIL